MVAMDATERDLMGLGSAPRPGDARLKCMRRVRESSDLRCRARNGSAPPRAQLSRREEEVADLVAQSLSNTAVARRLLFEPSDGRKPRVSNPGEARLLVS